MSLNILKYNLEQVDSSGIQLSQTQATGAASAIDGIMNFMNVINDPVKNLADSVDIAALTDGNVSALKAVMGTGLTDNVKGALETLGVTFSA